jgi:hypothetical protein
LVKLALSAFTNVDDVTVFASKFPFAVIFFVTVKFSGIVTRPVVLSIVTAVCNEPLPGFRATYSNVGVCDTVQFVEELTFIVMSVAVADGELMTTPPVVVVELDMFPDNAALSILTRSVLVTYPPLPLVTILGEITCCNMFLTVEVVAYGSDDDICNTKRKLLICLFFADIKHGTSVRPIHDNARIPVHALPDFAV